MTKEEAFEKLEVTVGAYLMSGNADNTYCKEWREILETLKQEPCEDCISRKSIKHKLQEHHDFFVNAHGGFSNLPQNDKSRVDEIINCIAMVVNEPSVQPQPKTGHWISDGYKTEEDWIRGRVTYKCPFCDYHDNYIHRSNYCPNCGAKLESED